VCQSHGDDLTEGIGERDLISYNRSERKAAYEKNQDELKRSHLSAGTPPYDANNRDQEQVTEKSTQNRSHCIQPLCIFDTGKPFPFDAGLQQNMMDRE
jgi:hypothetical protein